MGAFGGGMSALGGAITAGTAIVKMLPDFSQFGKQVESGMGKVTQRASALGSSLTRKLTLPILGLGAAAVKAFNDQAKVIAQTDAVIKSTGGKAGVSAKHVGELASGLQKTTAFADDVVQSGENLLLTFTNIRNSSGKNNDIFDQTTKIMLDMSQALGQDTKSSAIQLGKALNDPVKGVSALQRVGVSFTASQKEMIKSLVASGDTLGAQKLILEELRGEFGGSAEAFAKTDAGKMKQAMNDLSDAGEKLGGIIAPVLSKVAKFAGQAARALAGLPGPVQKIIVGILGVAAVVGPLLLVFAKVANAVQTINNVFKFGKAISKTAEFVTSVSKGMAKMVVDVAKATAQVIASIVKQTVSMVAAVARQIAAWVLLGIQALINAAKIAAAWLIAIGPIALVIAAVVGLVFIIIKHWDTIKNFTIKIWNSVFNFLKGIWDRIWNTVSTVFNAIKDFIAKWGTTILAIITGPIGILVLLIKRNFQTIKDTVLGVWNAIKDGARAAWNFITSKIKGAIDAVRKPIGGFINLLQKIPFVPGSPIPMVVGLTKSKKALHAWSQEAKRVVAPSVGIPSLSAARSQMADARMAGGTGAGSNIQESKHYNLTVNSRESLGSVRSDFRLMEAMTA